VPNRNVLRRSLKTVSDGADVASSGRSFHIILAPEIENAHPPTVVQMRCSMPLLTPAG